MFNFRKFISVSAVAILGVTNLLTSLTYAVDATPYDSLGPSDLEGEEHRALRFVMPDRDVFLYAVTAPNTYTVLFNGNTNTSWTMSGQKFTYDESGSLTTNVFEKIWYTFDKWNTEENGGGTSYDDHQEVKNLTSVDNAEIPIYAQWTKNKYYITYNLNDEDGGTSSWVHSKTPTTWVYDELVTIQNPSRTWYGFSGWTITNMSGTHSIGWVTGTSTTETEVTATEFMNLHPNGWVVNFKAIWSANENTKYTVKEYLEELTGDYPSNPNNEWTWAATTDQKISPNPTEHEWFTAPSPVEQNVDADGSTVFEYQYTRNSYGLKLIAGRWISSVSGSGEVTANQSFNDEGTINFKYDEQVTLNYQVKPWYTGAAWSGYLDTASSFKMPATWKVKEASATPITYTITQLCRGGAGCTQTTEYTVESGDITWPTPTRGDYSVFQWWTGWVDNEITNPTKPLTIESGSIYDRTYSAVWSCVTWYHIEEAGEPTESCQPDTNVKYLVNHKTQDLNWTDYTIVNSGYMYGTSNTQTQVTANNYEWFTLSGNIADYQTNIDREGNTVVNVIYNRNSYDITITNPEWGEPSAITSKTATAENPDGNKFKYDDKVTLAAVMADGYEFDHWEVKDGSGASVDVTNPENINGATFKMPASDVTIIPHLKQTSYSISYELNSWTVAWTNPTSYTVESGDIILIDPTRPNSEFWWWSGTDHNELFSWNVVAVSSGSTWNKSFEAIWWCKVWYHKEGNSCINNEYNVTVNYNDGGDTPDGHLTWTYDNVENLPEPEQSWYDFAWWTITWMSGGVEHTIGNTTTTANTASGVKGEDFKNLTPDEGGTVEFVAVWTPRNDVTYEVRHYVQNLSWAGYELIHTDNYTTWNVTVPVEVSSITWTYEWFTAPSVWYTSWSTAGWDGTSSSTITIDKHGNTIIYLYYSRNERHVYLSGNNDVALTWEGDYEYGEEVEVTATPKTWYHFVRWEKKNSLAELWRTE